MEFVILGILILITCLVIGMPIPFSFAATFIWLSFTLGYQTDFLLSAGYTTVNSVVLLAIPLFILAGGIMEKSKISCGHLTGYRCLLRRESLWLLSERAEAENLPSEI